MTGDHPLHLYPFTPYPCAPKVQGVISFGESTYPEGVQVHRGDLIFDFLWRKGYRCVAKGEGVRKSKIRRTYPFRHRITKGNSPLRHRRSPLCTCTPLPLRLRFPSATHVPLRQRKSKIRSPLRLWRRTCTPSGYVLSPKAITPCTFGAQG